MITIKNVFDPSSVINATDARALPANPVDGSMDGLSFKNALQNAAASGPSSAVPNFVVGGGADVPTMSESQVNMMVDWNAFFKDSTVGENVSFAGGQLINEGQGKAQFVGGDGKPFKFTSTTTLNAIAAQVPEIATEFRKAYGEDLTSAVMRSAVGRIGPSTWVQNTKQVAGQPTVGSVQTGFVFPERSDTEIKKFIDWWGQQINPITQEKFSVQWGEHTGVDPYADPVMRQHAIDVMAKGQLSNVIWAKNADAHNKMEEISGQPVGFMLALPNKGSLADMYEVGVSQEDLDNPALQLSKRGQAENFTPWIDFAQSKIA